MEALFQEIPPKKGRLIAQLHYNYRLLTEQIGTIFNLPQAVVEGTVYQYRKKLPPTLPDLLYAVRWTFYRNLMLSQIDNTLLHPPEWMEEAEQIVQLLSDHEWVLLLQTFEELLGIKEAVMEDRAILSAVVASEATDFFLGEDIPVRNIEDLQRLLERTRKMLEVAPEVQGKGLLLAELRTVFGMTGEMLEPVFGVNGVRLELLATRYTLATHRRPGSNDNLAQRRIRLYLRLAIVPKLALAPEIEKKQSMQVAAHWYQVLSSAEMQKLLQALRKSVLDLDPEQMIDELLRNRQHAQGHAFSGSITRILARVLINKAGLRPQVDTAKSVVRAVVQRLKHYVPGLG